MRVRDKIEGGDNAKILWMAGLAVVLVAGAAMAQSTVLGGRGAPVRAEAAVTAESLVGRWGDNGDCSADTEFRADGSFASAASGEGRWSLNGDRLTLEGAFGASEFSVLMMNTETVRFTGSDGVVKFQTRC
jgi:hypothetical protein